MRRKPSQQVPCTRAASASSWDELHDVSRARLAVLGPAPATLSHALSVNCDAGVHLPPAFRLAAVGRYRGQHRRLRYVRLFASVWDLRLPSGVFRRHDHHRRRFLVSRPHVGVAFYVFESRGNRHEFQRNADKSKPRPTSYTVSRMIWDLGTGILQLNSTQLNTAWMGHVGQSASAPRLTSWGHRDCRQRRRKDPGSAGQGQPSSRSRHCSRV